MVPEGGIVSGMVLRGIVPGGYGREALPPSPGHKSGWYMSYWNAFPFHFFLIIVSYSV